MHPRSKRHLTSSLALGLLAALAVGLLAPGARGESKDLVTIQARILQDGAPLDGDLSLTFEVYDDAAAGSLLWTETQTVPVRNGILAARLGATTSLGNTFKPSGGTSDRYVLIKNGSTAVAPRIRITAVPYAHLASRCDSAAIASAIDDGAGGSLTISGLDARYVANASALDGKGLVVDSGELAVGAGTGISVAADAVSVDVSALAGNGLEASSNQLRLSTAAAGNGLTGGGGSALAIDLATVSGLEIVSDELRVSTEAAGAGLTGGGASPLAVNPAGLIDGGAAAIDGDKLEVTFTPSNYTPPPSVTQSSTTIADSTDDLTAHLKGIDDALLAAASANVNAVGLPAGGRLVLSATESVTTADVTSSNLHYRPHRSDRLALHDGTSWVERSIGSGVTLALSGTSANQNYDVFAYWTGSAVALELLAWSNHGAGSSTRATDISRKDGVYVKGASGSQTTGSRYLGTIRTTGNANETCDTNASRFVWNYENRVRRISITREIDTWTSSATSDTICGVSGDATLPWQHHFVLGVIEDSFESWGHVGVQQHSGGGPHFILYLDGADASLGADQSYMWGASGLGSQMYSRLTKHPTNPGYHHVKAMHGNGASVTLTWGSANYRSGMQTVIWG